MWKSSWKRNNFVLHCIGFWGGLLFLFGLVFFKELFWMVLVLSVFYFHLLSLFLFCFVCVLHCLSVLSVFIWFGFMLFFLGGSLVLAWHQMLLEKGSIIYFLCLCFIALCFEFWFVLFLLFWLFFCCCDFYIECLIGLLLFYLCLVINLVVCFLPWHHMLQSNDIIKETLLAGT